jgi:hypothetical protein
MTWLDVPLDTVLKMWKFRNYTPSPGMIFPLRHLLLKARKNPLEMTEHAKMSVVTAGHKRH